MIYRYISCNFYYKKKQSANNNEINQLFTMVITRKLSTVASEDYAKLDLSLTDIAISQPIIHHFIVTILTLPPKYFK
jgi:hypothetical protein